MVANGGQWWADKRRAGHRALKIRRRTPISSPVNENDSCYRLARLVVNTSRQYNLLILLGFPAVWRGIVAAPGIAGGDAPSKPPPGGSRPGAASASAQHTSAQPLTAKIYNSDPPKKFLIFFEKSIAEYVYLSYYHQKSQQGADQWPFMDTPESALRAK